MTTDVERLPTRLVLRQGNSWRRKATFTFEAGNLSGAKIWMTLKRDPANQTDELADLRLDSALLGGVTILTTKTAQFDLTPAQTASLDPNREYQFDVKVLLSTGEVKTTDSGTIVVRQQVTRATE